MPASVSWQPKESTSRVCLQRVSWTPALLLLLEQEVDPNLGQARPSYETNVLCAVEKKDKEWQLDTLKHWYSKLLCQNTLC